MGNFKERTSWVRVYEKREISKNEQAGSGYMKIGNFKEQAGSGYMKNGKFQRTNKLGPGI
jgi:hypothetical protein